MPQLLIVWHSRTGGAEAMAKSAYDGAKAEVDARLVRARDAGVDDLLDADGYVFAAPENLAAISGEMKEFFDRVYYDVLGRIEGRPYAQMVCAGSDGESAVRQVSRIATGWRLREAQPPIIVRTNAQTKAEILAPKNIPEEDLRRCRTLGAAMAAGIGMGIF